jgi:hypothetical protein
MGRPLLEMLPQTGGLLVEPGRILSALTRFPIFYLPSPIYFLIRPQLLTRFSSPSLPEGLPIVLPVCLSNRASARKGFGQQISR